MNYLDFLKKLLAFGDKLPAALAIVQNIIAQLDQLAALFGVTPPIEHNAPEVTPDVLAAEGQIASIIGPSHEGSEHGRIGDGTLLRNLFAFVQAHPELLTLLLTFIK